VAALSALAACPAIAQDENDGGRLGGVIEAREVLVRPGETFAEVAERELGSAARGAPLADFNRLSPDAVLVPGQSVRIPIQVPATEEFAQVVFVKGRVLLNGEPAERGARMLSGDVLQTGDDGFAALQFSSGTTANLQPDTDVRLQRLMCRDGDPACLVDLATETGEIDVDVDTRDEQPTEFQLTTPYATAAVRGTEFVLAADPALMLVAVTEGAVQIEALGQRVPVPAGYGSVTVEGEPPGQTQALLPSPVLRNVPARVTGDDRVLLWPLSGAERYQASLSRDGAALQSVARFEVDGTEMPFEGIAAGELFLTVRGIDDSELPGLTTTTRLVVAAIDEALTPPSVSIERVGQEFLVSVEDPPEEAAGFEIQLSIEPGFVDPLSVDVGPSGRAVFRLDVDSVSARARQLDTPLNVSAFGPTASVR